MAGRRSAARRMAVDSQPNLARLQPAGPVAAGTRQRAEPRSIGPAPGPAPLALACRPGDGGGTGPRPERFARRGAGRPGPGPRAPRLPPEPGPPRWGWRGPPADTRGVRR